MKSTFNNGRLAALVLPVCWGLLTLATACGDDGSNPGDPDGDAGEAGAGQPSVAGKTNGGSSSQAGSSGATAGTAAAGKTAVGGQGGATEPGAGAGGQGEAEAGAGGEGGATLSHHPAKINGANGTLVPQVQDLRGITYSSTGKIWASGHVGVSTTYPGGVDRQLAVVRFNADGSLDSTFDGDGVKTFNLRTRQGIDENITNDGDEYSLGIVELPTGDLIISANVRDVSGKGRDAVLLKMSSAGALLNFSAGPASTPPAAAIRKIDFGWTDAQRAGFPGAPAAQPSDEAGGIALSPDKATLVIFGHGSAPSGSLTVGDAPVQRTDNDRFIVRVNVSTGLPDATFNAGLAYTFNTAGVFNDNSRRGTVEADGSIVSAGYANIDGSNNIVVLRLSAAGVPDATFTAGTPAVPGAFVGNPFAADGGIAECYAAGRQSTGRYVTVGYGRATKALTPSTFDPPWFTTDGVDLVSFGLKQGQTGGTLDTTFGVAGTLAIQSEGLNLGGTEDRGRELLVLPDDRVVFAGRLATAPALFVITPDGELDPDAGGALAGIDGADTVPGAYVYSPLSGSAPNFYALALSPDGKRVAATTNNHADGAVLAILDVQ